MDMEVALGSTVTPFLVQHPEWAVTVPTAEAAAITEQIIDRGMSSFGATLPIDLADLTAATAAATVDDETDGRSLRRSHNRTAVIISLSQLIREGLLDPSVPQI
ncbi:MAG: hypothetical protein ACJAZD_002911, partial [Ilumatobacter sp.]